MIKIMDEQLKKKLKVFCLGFFGFLLIGFGFTTKIGYQINTISFITGLILVIFSFILFIRMIIHDY